MTRDAVTPPMLTPALTRYTGYLMRRAYVWATECARRAIPAPFDVREIAILGLLETEGPLSQQQLAALVRVNRSVMVKLVDDLEVMGLVTRSRNRRDRRSYALVPTPEGVTALRDLQPVIATAEAELAGNLSTAEHDRLDALLEALLPGGDHLVRAALPPLSASLIICAHHYLRGLGAVALTPLGVELRHFGVLATVEEDEPCSQQHLATRLGISPQAVLPMVDELDAGGLLRRSRNAADRRAYDLTLTAEGRDRVLAARAALDTVEAEVAERLGEDGDRELRALLTRLLGGTPAQAPGHGSAQAPGHSTEVMPPST
jgi:DNA-binding MarR family transcriptional regulator